MDFRPLGGSGFKVPALSLGTGTFGGRGEFFGAWGASDVSEATRLIDVCLDAGLTMFDSADIYSGGAAEEILGAALKVDATRRSSPPREHSVRARGRTTSGLLATPCRELSRAACVG